MSRFTAPIAVLGAGSWGTALALVIARNGRRVKLWDLWSEQIEALIRERENRRYLPGFPLPNLIEPTPDLDLALAEVQEVLIVVPSHGFASLLSTLPPLAPEVGLAWATKGLEPGSNRLLHEVASDILGERDLAVVSGPSFAGEVARGLPTAVTVASPHLTQARRVAAYLHGAFFRAYTSHDIVGVQVGGAAKNVLAIATGIADGLGFGANTRAALITRGLAELTRLGTALGGRPETFMGLAGLGDLVLTCTDDQSRNRRLGLALARGASVEQARQDIGQEVEGVITSRAVHGLAQRFGIEMPICAEVYGVLYAGTTPAEATHNLLARESKSELD